MDVRTLYLSFIFELSSLFLLFNLDSIYKLIMLIAFHSIALFLLSSVFVNLLPKRFKKNKKASVLVIFFINFPILCLGYISVLILILIILRRQKNVEYKPFEFFSIEDILGEDIGFSGRKFGESSLFSVGKYETQNKNLKEKVILSIAEIKNPLTISILKENLSSKYDDIRLYAFSVISKLEKKFNEDIHTLKKKLESNDITDEERAELYFELASIYFDFVYFNIVSQEFENFMIEESLYYAEKSLDLKEKPETFLLLSKLYMRIGMLEKAYEYIMKVMNYPQINPLKYVPYLAEIYYKFGLYSEVKSLFEKYPNIKMTINPNIQAVVDFWSQKR